MGNALTPCRHKIFWNTLERTTGPGHSLQAGGRWFETTFARSGRGRRGPGSGRTTASLRVRSGVTCGAGMPRRIARMGFRERQDSNAGDPSTPVWAPEFPHGCFPVILKCPAVARSRPAVPPVARPSRPGPWRAGQPPRSCGAILCAQRGPRRRAAAWSAPARSRAAG